MRNVVFLVLKLFVVFFLIGSMQSIKHPYYAAKSELNNFTITNNEVSQEKASKTELKAFNELEPNPKEKYPESKDDAKFGVALDLKGPGWGRVLQNFAIDEKTGEFYTVQDEANNNNNLLINKLSPKGKSLGHITLRNFGHGNGLGLERLADDSIRLWTDYRPVDSRGYGTTVARVNFEKPSEVTSYKLCPPGYKVPFITIENHRRLLFLRAVHKKSKEERIFAFSLDHVLKGGKRPIFSFLVDPVQQAQSFQGLHVKNNLVYVLTGDSSLYTPKLLYIYDFSGDVLVKKQIGAGAIFAANNGGYYEPEGLYVLGASPGQTRVYVGIVTGSIYKDSRDPEPKINRLYFYDLNLYDLK